MWAFHQLMDIFAEAVRGEDARLRLEQAVHGVDSYDEVALHPVFSASLAEAGFGVLRETPYPTTWKQKSWRADQGNGLPLPRQRERCDLVVLERTGMTLADSHAIEKNSRKVKAELAGTLFEQLLPVTPVKPASLDALAGECQAWTARSSNPGETAQAKPEEALWVEIKVLGQYEFADGVPVPNGAYASRLVRGVVSDLAKLATDVSISHSAVLLILFAADEEVARHDVFQAWHRCLDRDLPIASPMLRVVPISDRIGNTVCVLTAFSMRAT
ncbi:MAG: hypothetical protein H7210_09650 [Pyrinomonadaceae bacterium]|nr:hypothetical protein [Phycisphaerales bacterium]